MAKHQLELTGTFFKELGEYLGGNKPSESCAKELGLTRAQFLERVKEAFTREVLVIRPPKHQDLSEELRAWGGAGRLVEAYVVRGAPDDHTFARAAAERLLEILKKLLLAPDKNPVNIGIVSGSTTGAVIERLAQSGLWDEVMAPAKLPVNKQINVLTLNVTPVIGWELEGNGNIATLRLAAMLRDKLPECEVTPYGLSTDLVIKESERERTDNSPTNRRVLEFTDPAILSRHEAIGSEPSKLHLVITGVGSPEGGSSVFQEVLADQKILAPAGMVGDVAFWPVDRNGNELALEKDGTRYLIYSVIRLVTMQALVNNNAYVMLIARNVRRCKHVDKSEAIRAAIRGKIANVIFTDEATARQIVSNPA